MMQRRRQATKEELEKGEEEMKQAEARMRTEAANLGEEPIEDGKVEVEERREIENGPQIEGKPEDLQRKSPEVNTPRTRPGVPSTPPPAQPPVLEDKPIGPKTPDQVSAVRKSPEVKSSAAPSQERTATAFSADKVYGNVQSTPLFTDEQARALNQLHDQAPWMYQSGRSVFSPYPNRPAFLEHEEERLREGLTERERQVQFMRERLFQEQLEKEELRKAVSNVLEDNQRMKTRLQELESKVKDADLRFSTPDGSQEAETTKDPRGSKEAETTKEPRGSKEAETTKEHGSSKEAETPKSKDQGRAHGAESSASAGSGNMSEKFMLVMMESMKEMQKKLLESKEEAGMVKGVEVVRSGVPDLPQLPAWSPAQGPLQLGDWLLLLEPLVADLSTTSEQWWTRMSTAAQEWYQKHTSLSPLDRIQHQVTPPMEVQQEKWQRLERRMSAMLLQAIPELIRDELVASRRLSVFGILTHLYTIYCPGGVYEKQTLLKNLEEPAEVTAITEAPGAIRKWLRWRRRTEEIGAVAPDPALLLKGLNRLTRKVVEPNKELQFRISMVRNSLGVDTTPTAVTVGHFATHLLAEIEQVALTEKRTGPPAAKVEAPKIKAFEVEKSEKGKGRGSERQAEESPGKTKCKFYLSEGGCRKGKQCTYSHEARDEKRRCWTCGAVDHMSSSCTRPKSTSVEGSPTRMKGMKMEQEDRTPSSKETDAQSSASTEMSMKELMEEANKMLKSLSSSGGTSSSPSSPTSKEEETKTELMEKLQQQLNSMKLKTLRLGRIAAGENQGLLDSGATNPLRPRKPGEDTEEYKKLEVTLADGTTTRLPVSPGGAMVSSKKETEPIVPMHQLMELLGCEVRWKGSELEIYHPTRGRLPVQQPGGCPQVPRALAMDLIAEIEDRVQGIGPKKTDFEEEEAWMRKLVQEHPVLRSLPHWIKERLVVSPGEWNGLPLNRRMRRRLKQEGFVLHLYAGEKEGFSLQRALKQVGGDEARLLEIDVKRGQGHDMLSDTQVYPSLLRAAVEGKLRGVLGGPNCRTRSVLRHYPIEGNPQAPRPVREWKGGEFGKEDLSPQEEAQVREDDILLWRMIFIYMVAHYMAKARGLPRVHLALEQPASPKQYLPEVVSFWDTTEWKEIRTEFNLHEVNFEQKKMGGPATKPTTVAGTLEFDTEDDRWNKGRNYAKVSNSKDLARWPPGLMHMMAVAIVEQILHQEVKIKALSWEEHLAFGHLPYRRDCRVCQESLQQADVHRRVRNPMGGILSIDVAGPMKPAYDQGGGQARWMLVGALTWRVPKGTTKMVQPPEEPLGEDAPEIEEGGQAGEEREEEAQEEQQPGEVGRGGRQGGGGPGNRLPERDCEGGGDPEQLPPDIEAETELRVFRIALPMVTKTSKEVTRTTMEFLLRLRADGYRVHRIHCDRGHEFAGEFKRWANARGIHITRTPGDDPRGNGRAEVTVKAIKTQIRRTLRQAFETSKWWPWACRYVTEINRCVRLDEKPEWPGFLREVRVKKRQWKRGDFEVGVEKVQYLCPSSEDHGHWVYKEGEAPRVTRCLMRATTEPLDERVWVAIEKEMVDALVLRRRLRQKTAVRRLDASLKAPKEEDEVKKRVRDRIMKVVEEEARRIIGDDPELAAEELKIVAKLKKMAEGIEMEEEEVLQTKIVGPREVAAKWKDWLPAIEAEVHSLVVEKEALKMLSKEDLRELKEATQRSGTKLETVPSKMVFTVKPGPDGGKLKARWVACGNFESKKEDENNYSSGADATAFRVLVWKAAKEQWVGVVIDVKTAFLNAAMEQRGEEGILLIKPPVILVEKQFMPCDAHFLPLRAVYGFRRSPRLWGDHRDGVMKTIKVEVSCEGQVLQLVLEPLESEPNLWKVVQAEGENQRTLQEEFQLYGMVMTYVDDIFITGRQAVVDALLKEFQKIWTTSKPEWVSSTPVRFLGMEITKEMNAETQREAWFITQESYIKDLVNRQEEEVKEKKIPISRDQAAMEVDEETPSLDMVRKCQKAVGEVLWLVTRTRPDIMFAVARMGANVTRATKKVMETASQLWGFLKKTSPEGLKFEEAAEEEPVVQVYSDASFAPEGEESHGSYLVMINRCPLFWRSGRQASVTLSTGEAELNELVEGLNAGESVAVLLEEIQVGVRKMAWTDSSTAVSILTSEGGSWRTRHLRLRSAYARQAILGGVWGLNHLPGEKMVADLGTKALTSTRIEALKSLMGMGQKKKQEAEKEKEKVEDPPTERLVTSKDQAIAAVRLITLVAMMSAAKGQDDEEGEEMEASSVFHWMVAAYTVMVIVATVAVQAAWKVAVGMIKGETEEPQSRKSRSRPNSREKPKLEKGDTPGDAGLGGGDLNLLPGPGDAGLGGGDPNLLPEAGEAAQESQPPEACVAVLGGGDPGSARAGHVGQSDTASSSRDPDPQMMQQLIQELIAEDERKEREWRELEEDEAMIRRELNTPGSALWVDDEPEEAAVDLKVYYTQYGGVYHTDRNCGHLRGPKVGPVSEGRWCRTCQKKAGRQAPLPGKEVLLGKAVKIFHTDLHCPKGRKNERTPVCQSCGMK